MGGEYFTFNLFRDDSGWVLHPFDGMLLRNQAMCTLVAQELFKHKPFQVMLAKEGILFTDIRSTVNLDNVNAPVAARNEREPRGNLADDLMEFVQQHSIEEVIDYECKLVGSRISFLPRNSTAHVHGQPRPLGPRVPEDTGYCTDLRAIPGAPDRSEWSQSGCRKPGQILSLPPALIQA
ncbi:hypothetical protein ACFTAO_12910 [Paenibacillus rhizoplanae]